METKNLIMIDDDEDDFLLLRESFHQHAPWVEFIWFDSPKSFIDSQIWQRKSIHLFVFDLLVGPEAGPYWQAPLRERAGCQFVPMVIHSGSEAPGDREIILQQGAADFVVKAVSTDEMKQVVNRLLTHLV